MSREEDPGSSKSRNFSLSAVSLREPRQSIVGFASSRGQGEKFVNLVSFFKDDRIVRAMLHAVGLANDIVGAEGALLGGLAVGCGHYRTERADENARKAPHALIFIYAHNALFVLGKGARYAAF